MAKTMFTKEDNIIVKCETHVLKDYEYGKKYSAIKYGENKILVTTESGIEIQYLGLGFKEVYKEEI